MTTRLLNCPVHPMTELQLRDGGIEVRGQQVYFVQIASCPHCGRDKERALIANGCEDIVERV